eukprot:1891484-Amphidinium_carterae.2
MMPKQKTCIARCRHARVGEGTSHGSSCRAGWPADVHVIGKVVSAAPPEPHRNDHWTSVPS